MNKLRKTHKMGRKIEPKFGKNSDNFDDQCFRK